MNILQWSIVTCKTFRRIVILQYRSKFSLEKEQINGQIGKGNWVLCTQCLSRLLHFIFMITITNNILLSSFYRGSSMNWSELVNSKSRIEN